MKLTKTNGSLVLQEVKFENYLKKRVISNNKTSGKITLPKSLVGKEVYIIVPEENE